MAAGEQQTKPVVVERGILHFFKQLESACFAGVRNGQLHILRGPPVVPAEAVDRFPPSHGDDPSRWVVGNAVFWPPLQSRGQGILHRLLGLIKISEEANEGGQDLARLLPKQ
jgi:hypothetical protein